MARPTEPASMVSGVIISTLDTINYQHMPLLFMPSSRYLRALFAAYIRVGVKSAIA
jgi:hypothetical protein